MDVTFAMEEIQNDFIALADNMFEDIGPGTYPVLSSQTVFTKPVKFNASDYFAYKTGFLTVNLLKNYLTGKTTLSAATKNLNKRYMVTKQTTQRSYGRQVRGYYLTEIFFKEFPTDKMLSKQNNNPAVQELLKKESPKGKLTPGVLSKLTLAGPRATKANMK